MRNLTLSMVAALALATLTWNALAQDEGAITAKLAAAPVTVQAGQEVELQITLSVPAPWHVFGDTPGSAGQQKLKIDMKLPEGMESVSDWKWPEHESVFEGYEVHIYNAGDHVFRRKVKVKPGVKGPIALKGTLTYQACTPEFCGPVEVIDLSTELKM